MPRQTLDEVMKSINTQFKSKIANTGIVFQKVPRIPFSSPRMNYMLYGGIPQGRLIEFAGEEGGGKTTSALDLVGNAQRMFPDKKVVYIDVERTLDPEWASKLGVNVDALYLITPDEQTAEQEFEMAKSLVETGEVSLCVIDSLAAMVSAQAYSKTIEDKTYGGISTALTLFSKEMIPICARTGCALIGINQLREDMNSSYGGTITTGGRAWRHNCSVRLTFSKSDYIDDKGVSLTRGCENPAGHLVKVALVKSKVSPLNRKIGFYTLRYLDGIDFVSDIIDVAAKEGIIEVRGAWYYLMDTDSGEIFLDENKKDLKFQGKPKMRDFLIANQDWRDEIVDQINEKIS